MENKSFNIFRINCLISDKDSQTLNGIIESIVCELLYDNGNTEICANEIYKYLTEYINIKLDLEYLTGVLRKSKSFEINETADDVCFVLKGDRLIEIGNKIQTESIEEWLSKYCKEFDLAEDIEQGIHEILYSALYENINSFVSNDIKSILSEKLKNQHPQATIDHFNDFLDWDNSKKNESLYKSFLKATEFAILTSGRGVQDFSEKIFNNKTYLLDSNIVFRLLGVGGPERQENLINLIENCVHAGIRFKFSNISEIEFNRKLEERVSYFNNVASKRDFDILEGVVSDNPKINYSFETFYIKLRKDKTVKSPNDFQFYLKTELRKLKEKYGIENEAIKSKLNTIKLDKLKNHLFKAKKREHIFNYTKKAAEVDATNAMYVESIRGHNNYNYSDIKSFYLTTDRTLNKILSSDDSKVAETILPSQLFILHNGEKIIEQKSDFKDFVKFLKRRTTQFKLSGNSVFEYINEVRTFTSDETQIVETLKAFSDYKYSQPEPCFNYEADMTGFREFAATQFDRQINELNQAATKHRDDFKNAVSDLPRLFKISVVLSIIIELGLIVLISIIILNNSSNQLYSFIPLTLGLLDKLVGYFLNDRFGFYNWLRNGIFFKIIKSNSFYKYSTSKEEYMTEAERITKGNNV